VSCRRCTGNLFHMHGPAAVKLRSPKLLWVRGTMHVLAAEERSWRRSLSAASWMSSAMYGGAWLHSADEDAVSCLTSYVNVTHTRRRRLECVVLNIANSGQFWAVSAASVSVTVRLWDFTPFCTVLSRVILGRPGGLFQPSRGSIIRIFVIYFIINANSLS